jgi:hypothetical protein
MRPIHVRKRAVALSFLVLGIGLAVIPTASADPTDPDQTEQQPAGPGTGLPSTITPVSADSDPAAADACKQFSAAMNYAATNYEDFAYATAGEGNYVNYGDPNVTRSNTIGRSALREAAGVAMDASNTPGLPPEISAPMRAWSLHAGKLLVIMGLRGGGDSLNSTATELNTDARNVQMSCAAAGARV